MFTHQMALGHTPLSESDMPTVQCLKCPKKFYTEALRKKHDKKVHGDQVYPCGQCGKVYKAAYSLEEHIKSVHNGEVRKFQLYLLFIKYINIGLFLSFMPEIFQQILESQTPPGKYPQTRNRQFKPKFFRIGRG